MHWQQHRRHRRPHPYAETESIIIEMIIVQTRKARVLRRIDEILRVRWRKNWLPAKWGLPADSSNLALLFEILC